MNPVYFLNWFEIKTANENEMLLYIMNTYIYLEYVYVQSTVEKKFLLSS